VGLTGEGFGNFGLFGACLWGALLGCAARLADDWAGTGEPSPLALLFRGTLLVWVAMIVRGGVPEMFYMGVNVALAPLVVRWVQNRGAASR